MLCFSMYEKDIVDLSRKVKLLKQHGWAGANRSHLVRIALARLSEEDLLAIAEAKPKKVPS